MTQTAATAVPEAAQPRLNRRQAAKIKTRQKVLDAARTLFAERGYEPATIRDIAKGAGMSTGAVFANFQDKAELFEAVLSDDMAASLINFRNGAAIEGSVRDRLVNILSAGYHRSLQQLPLMQAVIARSWFQPDDMDKRSQVFIKPLRDVILEVLQVGVRANELRQDLDAPLLARMIWDLYVSNFRFAAYEGWETAQLTTHATKQIDLILAGQLTK